MSDTPIATTHRPLIGHIGEPLELVTTEGRFVIERCREADYAFGRLTVERFGFDEDPFVIHVAATDALDLAGRLRQLAEEIGAHR